MMEGDGGASDLRCSRAQTGCGSSAFRSYVAPHTSSGRISRVLPQARDHPADPAGQPGHDGVETPPSPARTARRVRAGSEVIRLAGAAQPMVPGKLLHAVGHRRCGRIAAPIRHPRHTAPARRRPELSGPRAGPLHLGVSDSRRLALSPESYATLFWKSGRGAGHPGYPGSRLSGISVAASGPRGPRRHPGIRLHDMPGRRTPREPGPSPSSPAAARAP